MNIKIILADDHRIVREGFRALLTAQKDFQIVAETGDGREAMRLVEQFKPDVLLVDLMMPGLGGLEVTRQLAQEGLRTRVIVLSMHSNEAYVSQALKNGASGYILKDATSGELIHAVREVGAGRRYLSPPLSERAIEEYRDRARGTETVDRYETLTTREREILHLSAEGYTNVEIGKQLFISPRTVETHRAHLMRKLTLRTHTDLIRYALQRGIIDIDARKKRS
jgi:two-component system, NarL family, response regulator NreC